MITFTTVDQIIDFAIEAEQEAVDFYTKLAEGSSSEAIKKVFTLYAAEEAGHKKKLILVKQEGYFANLEVNHLNLSIISLTYHKNFYQHTHKMRFFCPNQQ